MQIYPSTCSYFYSLDLLLCIINLQHQPLIKSNTNKNTKPTIVIIDAMEIKTATTDFYKLPILHFYNKINQTNRPDFICPWTSLFIPSCTVLLSLSIECCNALGHPLLIVDLFHIMHKQTNKIFYPNSQVSLKQSLQLLPNNDNIKFAFCTKKSWQPFKTKTKTLKRNWVHDRKTKSCSQEKKIQLTSCPSDHSTIIPPITKWGVG